MPLWKGSQMAIFNAEQVDSINDYQKCGQWHPFTCGNKHDGARILVANEDGMKCPTCDYTQDWVHDFMANRNWEKELKLRAAVFGAARKG